MGCCNAAAPRRQPSLAPFNLFRGRKILFLCEAAQLRLCDVCYFDRARHQRAGKRKWYHDVVRASAHQGGNCVGKETHRLNSCLDLCGVCLPGPSCSRQGRADMFSWCLWVQQLDSDVSPQSQQALTGTRYLLLYLSPPINELPKNF